MPRGPLPFPESAMIDPQTLLLAYASGIFPMADSREDDEVYWVEPRRRAIFPLDAMHFSRSLLRTIKQDKYRVTIDSDFRGTMQACAAARPGREDSWINPVIINSYCHLHKLGHAHSIECWQDDQMVGGLYGVSLGRVFCGESMFSTASDASKVALAWLVAAMRSAGFALLDCQFMTDHLARLGAVEISQKAYLQKLDQALAGTIWAPRAHRPQVSAGGGASSAGSASVDGDAAGAGSALRTLPEGLAALLSSPDLGADSSSPGKRISHFLTQTS